MILVPDICQKNGLTVWDCSSSGSSRSSRLSYGSCWSRNIRKTFVRVMGTSTCDVMVSPYDE